MLRVPFTNGIKDSNGSMEKSLKVFPYEYATGLNDLGNNILIRRDIRLNKTVSAYASGHNSVFAKEWLQALADTTAQEVVVEWYDTESNFYPKD